MKTMAEVLINHPWLPDHEGLYTGLCPSCPGVKIHGGHNSPSHAAHQAEALAAAGYGPVREAQATVLRDAADKIMGPSDVPLDGATCRWNAMELRERADQLATP